MNKAEYLQRIGLDEFDLKPNLENIKLLQRHHLMNIPFENLDIHWKISIVLDTENFYRKIVENKRGGFCYELNSLFNELLKAVGYKTKMISARVCNRKGDFGKEYDHLTIITEIEREEYLVDVGFGDFIFEPLKFVLDIEQKDANGTYLIRKFDDEYFEVVKNVEDDWQSEYIFKDKIRDLLEFEGMCNFHQSSKSHFSKGKVCSMMTKSGRKTLTDKKFIINQNENKYEIEIDSEMVFAKILKKEFNIKK